MQENCAVQILADRIGQRPEKVSAGNEQRILLQILLLMVSVKKVSLEEKVCFRGGGKRFQIRIKKMTGLVLERRS